MDNLDLFASCQNTIATSDENSGFLTIIPTSVIDIGAQKKREAENHGSTSSRSNYSPFPKEVVSLCYEFFLRDSKNIFDPFAGWGERHEGAIRYGKNYTGYDISQESIDKAFETYGVENKLKDSMFSDIPLFDGLITCPPYWNLEKYGSDKSLCREKTFHGFLLSLKAVLKNCYNAASNGANFCIVVGDWRSKGVYYDLEYQVCNMFKDFYGSEIVDKVIISRKNVSKIKIMLPQCKRLGYSVKVHETLLVFKKATRLSEDTK